MRKAKKYVNKELLPWRSALQMIFVGFETGRISRIKVALGIKTDKIAECPGAESMWQLLGQQRPRLIVIDVDCEAAGGLETVQAISEHDSEIAIVLMAESVSAEAAIAAIRVGATDYIPKSCSGELFKEKALRAFGESIRKDSIAQKEEELVELFQMEGILGRGPGMRELFGRIRRVAPHFETLLLLGETGTGKELFARAVHNLGLGSEKPFVAVNCAAFQDTLFESEVFGYVRGAFTGAERDHVGLMTAANGGTLFLDELGDLSLQLQAKLLRAIQLKEVRRIGATKSEKVDIRIIAATNRNLIEMVSRNEFREDLYYRLATLSMQIPPLRERKEDLPLLIAYIMKNQCRRYKKPGLRLSTAAQTRLLRYDWPGNVRELESVLSFCCLTTDRMTIEVRNLPAALREDPEPESPRQLPAFATLGEVEMRHIQMAIEMARGNLSSAARLLGISRATLHRHLSRNKEKMPIKEKRSAETASTANSNA